MSTNATSGDGNPSVDPIAGLVDQFVTSYQVPRILKGERPALRAVFRRFHGAAHGTFAVQPDLPAELRVGLFAHDTFPAWVRFSADTVPGGPDVGQMNGIGIKLFGVPGRKLLEPDAATHDFVLQNVARFFVDDAQAMYEFTDHPDDYQRAHAVTGAILGDMAAQRGSVLRIPYWSCLPSKFGEARYVKYVLLPDGEGDVPPSGTPAPDYLAIDLRHRLTAGEATFTFAVQFYADDATTPLDRATVLWPEQVTPPVPLATLTLPRQDVDARGNAEYAENLSFTPWHALSEHEPVGSIHAARRAVYAKSAEARRYANGVPNEEPRAPQPATPPYPAGTA